jgi:hypothetical protein
MKKNCNSHTSKQGQLQDQAEETNEKELHLTHIQAKRTASHTHPSRDNLKIQAEETNEKELHLTHIQARTTSRSSRRNNLTHIQVGTTSRSKQKKKMKKNCISHTSKQEQLQDPSRYKLNQYRKKLINTF